MTDFNQESLQPNIAEKPTFKKIRILQVVFGDELKSWEIPAFRGAVAQKAGQNSILFHNHFDENKLRYAYPLIQYKTLKGKPMLLCIEEGVDEAHHFFTKKDWGIDISGRHLDMKIEKMLMDQITLQVWDHSFKYRIKDWIALNQENHSAFKLIDSDSERRTFLEGKLTGNIISMAKGLDWHISKPITMKITGDVLPKIVKVKGMNTLAFNLEFSTNVFLPQYIGLGKNVTFGYGIVSKIVNKKEEANG